jgi:hypothetical protein
LLQFIFPNAMGHPVTAIVKTFLDQAIMAPAGIALFFTAMGVLEGKSTSQVRRYNDRLPGKQDPESTNFEVCVAYVSQESACPEAACLRAHGRGLYIHTDPQLGRSSMSSLCMLCCR